MVYDDETIKKLLDRNQEQDNKKEKDDDEPSFGMNDYLRSFKVATYNVKDVAEEVSSSLYLSHCSLKKHDPLWQAFSYIFSLRKIFFNPNSNVFHSL